HERDDDDTERPDKRGVVIGISRPLSRVVTGVTVLSSPGVPLRAILTQYALLVDVATKESVVKLQ
nr:hypothetical protein [Tanacetum cinerariifolium]